MDLVELEKYVEKGLISKQKHLSLPLYIYNYTPECVYSRSWDNITLQCRGLILDESGKVIGRPFPKFFNYEEVNRDDIPRGIPKIFKKLDGSLIIVCNYEKNLVVATRGSFTSSQAIKAEKLLRDNKELYNTIMSLENQFTYLFELIGPLNRIVVTYDKDKLVLLGVKVNYNGGEHNLEYYRELWKFVEVVEDYEMAWNENSIEELRKLNTQNEEGFVLKWENGYRLKVKFEEYVRLHRIITGLSERGVWEWMKEGRSIENLLKEVPEEFRKWVRNTVKSLSNSWISIARKCQEFIESNQLRNISRKEAAILIIKFMKPYQSILFSILDNDYVRVRENIFKLIKPSKEKYFNIREE